MRLPAVLRLGLVGLACLLFVVIYWQWQPAAAEISDPSVAELDLPDTREVASMTEGLRVTENANGLEVFSIAAERHVDFEEGWNIWEEITLEIRTRAATGAAGAEAEPGVDPGAETRDPADEVIRVVGERMRTLGEINDIQSVVVLGNVEVTMPGGVEFFTRRLDYDATTGVVSNCNRNNLRYVDLEIRANCLRFETSRTPGQTTHVAAGDVRLWGDVLVGTDPEGGGDLPEGLRGSAAELVFRPGGEEVTLGGRPTLDFADAQIRGTRLLLEMSPEARSLRHVEARGDARLRLGGDDARAGSNGAGDAEATDGEAGGEPDDAGSSDTSQLVADVIRVEVLESGGVGAIHGTTDVSPTVRLLLADLGRLVAREIDLIPGAEHQEANARGDVVWDSRDEAALLPRLRAGALTLRIAGTALERLEATAGVEADLEAGDGEQTTFRGEALRVIVDDEGATSAVWPEGVQFAYRDLALSAGRAAFDPERRVWTLSGEPRPTVLSGGAELRGRALQITDAGTAIMSGGVEGDLGGDRLAAVRTLVGDADAVEVFADSATFSPEGWLRLQTAVRLIWREETLLADRLTLDQNPARARAQGNVELIVSQGLGGLGRSGSTPSGAPGSEDEPAAVGDPRSTEAVGADEAAGGASAAESGVMTLTATNLLIEAEPAEIRAAGGAVIRDGARRIEAVKIAVTVTPDGTWQTVRAEEQVEFVDGEASATGVAMSYTIGGSEIVLEGTSAEPALFVHENVEHRSTGALSVVWEDEQIIIRATENGRTRTKVVERAATATTS